MDAGAIGALIPVVAVGGFFAWLIALAVSKAYTAKSRAPDRAAAGVAARQEEVLAALDELRREVGELSERMDFAERLLAKQRDLDRLAPPS